MWRPKTIQKPSVPSTNCPKQVLLKVEQMRLLYGHLAKKVVSDVLTNWECYYLLVNMP
jgi:hypothetical protein